MNWGVVYGVFVVLLVATLALTFITLMLCLLVGVWGWPVLGVFGLLVTASLLAGWVCR